MVSEVEQLRKIPCGTVGVARVWEPCLRIPQLVEEGLDHGVDGRQALRWRVLQKLRDEVDSAGVGFPEHLSKISPCSEVFSNGKLAYLVERVRLNLGEFVLHIVGVHGADLVARGCPQDLDDLDELVDARFAGK